MKIIGIGIDILNSNRIKKMSLKKKIIFANKILHYSEIIDMKNNININNFLSNRFVIKEATLKAFGIGMRNGLSFNQIKIIYNKYGKPNLKFYKKANFLIKSLNITNVNISLSHDNYFSLAIVVLEQK